MSPISIGLQTLTEGCFQYLTFYLSKYFPYSLIIMEKINSQNISLRQKFQRELNGYDLFLKMQKYKRKKKLKIQWIIIRYKKNKMQGKKCFSLKKYIGVLFSSIMRQQLYPLTKNQPITNLPVGNKKLIIYQLQQLATISDMDTVIVIYSQQTATLRQYLQTQFVPNYPAYPHTLSFFLVEDKNPEYSSLQMLLTSPLFDGFQDGKSIFIVPPNVISAVKFDSLLNFHIERQGDLTMLLKQKKQYGKDEKKPDFQYEAEVDIALVSEKGQIFALITDFNNEQEQKKSSLPPSVYHRVKRATFQKVFDSTIYIFGPRIIKIVKNLVNESIYRIKNEFVDLVIRNQSNSNLLDYIHEKNTKPLKIFAKVQEQNEYIRRINSLKIYQSVNLDSLIRGVKQKEVLLPNIYTQPLDEKIMLDFKGSLIGKGSQIDTGIKITRSVIENGCKIGKNVQICNSIIMSGCVIQQGCKINNSIICPNCHIKAQSTVVGSKLAINCILQKGQNLEGQVLIPPK